MANFLSVSAEQFLDPLVTLWNATVTLLPQILLAIILLLFGYILAAILGHVIRIIFKRLKIDTIYKKFDIPQKMKDVHVSSIFGELTKWFIFLIFLQSAVSLLDFGELSSLLTEFVLWIPNLIFAVIAIFLGVFIAYYLENKIVKHAQIQGAVILSAILKYIIIILSFLIGIRQLGIDITLLERTFLILVAGLSFGSALALGIAFGLGLQGKAKKIAEKFLKRL